MIGYIARSLSAMKDLCNLIYFVDSHSVSETD